MKSRKLPYFRIFSHISALLISTFFPDFRSFFLDFSNIGIIQTKVGIFLVWHKPHKFEMDLGRLAPASEVTEWYGMSYCDFWPKLESKVEVPNWGPKNRGPKLGSLIGVLNRGPKLGSQIGVPNWGPKSGPKSGSQIKVPNQGPKSGSQIGVPKIGVPNWGP
jgi:hypothetical protein